MTRRRGDLVASVLVVATLASACGGGGAAGAEPQASSAANIEGVRSFPGVSREHVAAAVSYPQSPPVGGDHWPPRQAGVLGWQACRIYNEAVVNEFAVHSLEHGAVWLTYRPGVAASEVAGLAGLAALRSDYVLVSPFPGQQTPFAATAWGLQLTTQSADDVRLGAFTRQYAGGGQGGEQGADCAGGSNLEQARAALRAVS